MNRTTRLRSTLFLALCAAASCSHEMPRAAAPPAPVPAPAGYTDNAAPSRESIIARYQDALKADDAPAPTPPQPQTHAAPDTTTGMPATSLPPLPALTGIHLTAREDSVGIDFNPVDGAVDYRVYPLPADENVTIHPGGANAIRNAVYRCAGLRQAFDVANNLNGGEPGLTTPGQYAWHTEIEPQHQLGYVYIEPGEGHIPIYAVAGTPSWAEQGWRESRFKIYTADLRERAQLLDAGWRDDGIVFYAPRADLSGTHIVYGQQSSHIVAGQGWRQREQRYYLEAGRAGHLQDGAPLTPAFSALDAPAAGTEPLLAVIYSPNQSHMELVAGPERFQRAAYQGNGPLWHLEWSGLRFPTTLVVEALASGCPYQGFQAAEHLEAPPHQTFFTLGEQRALAPDGELFVNGQYDTAVAPMAIARSFIQAAPRPHDPADWDWYAGFGSREKTPPVPVPGCTDLNCARSQTPLFDISTYRLDKPRGVPVFTYGQVLGQLWVSYDDAGSDVTGKVRFTARQPASVAADTYLHVTFSVNIVSTDRRYPQLIVSDQPAPVQEGLSRPENNTLLIQPIHGPSMRIEAQAIHGLVGRGPWDVNNQAPEHRFIDYDEKLNGNDPPPSPADPPFEHAGVDRMTTFDAYISSQRMYLFLDGAPAGCSRYPAPFHLKGPVSVTFGDVLYHEGAADELVCAQSKPYGYLHRHQCSETTRHFDDLGFKSGAALPAWDEAKFPCVAY